MVRITLTVPPAVVFNMPLQPIFQDTNGLAVKFFIQKDLPQEVQAELCETITVSGPNTGSSISCSLFVTVPWRESRGKGPKARLHPYPTIYSRRGTTPSLLDKPRQARQAFRAVQLCRSLQDRRNAVETDIL